MRARKALYDMALIIRIDHNYAEFSTNFALRAAVEAALIATGHIVPEKE